MRSQSCALPITACSEHHPSCASGRIVGLRIPGSRAVASATFSTGRFISTYFMSRLSRIDRKRKTSCSVWLRLVGVERRAGDERRFGAENGFHFAQAVRNERPARRNDVEDRVRQPYGGAISTDPSMV